MKKSLIFALVALAINGSSLFAFAEEKILLKDAIKYAFDNNNTIKAIKSSLSASERDIGIAKSNIMPKLKAEEAFVSTNNPGQAFMFKIDQRNFTPADLAGAPNTFNNPGVVNNFLTGVTLEQPIYSRKANISIAMAKKEYSAQGYQYLRKQEELAQKVSQTYLLINTAQEFLYVAQQGITDAKEHLRVAQVRYKSGLGLYSDVLRAQTALSSAEQTCVSAQKNLNVAKRALGLLLGKQTSVDIAEIVPELKLKNADYYNDLSQYRTDIKAMQLNVENSKNNIKLANSAIFPTIGTLASYQLYDSKTPFGTEGHNYIAGAFLKWDIFDGNQRKYETLKAKDKSAEAKEYLEGLKQAVSYKVFDSYSSVEEAAKNVELACAAAKSAEEGQRLVLKRWQNSLSSFVDLLDAQTNLDKARADVVKSHNHYKASLINLSFESGILLKELGLE